MFQRILFYIKFKFLLTALLVGLIINFQLVFISISLISLKIYLKSKKIIYLIFIYVFLSFSAFDFLAPKINLEKTDYVTTSNIEYDIHKDFGYHPKKNSELIEKIYFKGDMFKINNYSINEYGHRITSDQKVNINKCIVFFGGSIIFGQSLNNNETLPYFTSKKLKPNQLVFNYAFNGYGPHQFLSKIENDYLDELINCKKLNFVYLYINDHVGRVVGKRSWGSDSPRYILDGDKLYQKGFFSSYPFKIVMKLRKNIRNSKTISVLYDVNRITEKDEYLFVRILEEIEKKTKSNYPLSEIIYIAWYKNELPSEIVKNFFINKKTLELDKLNIPLSYLSNNIPGDNHPTKKFNDLLSNELINFFDFN